MRYIRESAGSVGILLALMMVFWQPARPGHGDDFAKHAAPLVAAHATERAAV